MIRLTGGELRGRSIQVPASLRTRPTQAKLRQALFNSLQTVIRDARVLDLFAGSGALAFEALSRGAAEAVLVESDRAACRLIDRNASSLGLRDRVRILGEPVLSARERLRKLGPFDVVLADPPYAGGHEEGLLRDFAWGELLVPDGVLCIEWGTQKSRIAELPEQVGFLVKTREKNYGDTVLTTYTRTEIDHAEPQG